VRADLSDLLDGYIQVKELDYAQVCLAEKFKEDLFSSFIIGVSVSTFFNDNNKNRLSFLSEELEKIRKNIGFEVKNIEKLMEKLKENETKFYYDVLNSNNPNFLISSYYTFYLRFIELVKLRLENNTNADIHKIANFLTGFFGIPILIYLKKKEIIPCISELAGILLHMLVSTRNR